MVWWRKRDSLSHVSQFSDSLKNQGVSQISQLFQISMVPKKYTSMFINGMKSSFKCNVSTGSASTVCCKYSVLCCFFLQCEDLRALNVSGNFFITSKGFQLMVDNNPRIVWFVASKCSRLEDTSVIYMLKEWKRLIRLEINKNICLNGEFANYLGPAAEYGRYLAHVSANKLGVRQSENISFKRGGQVIRHTSEDQQIPSDNEDFSNNA